MSNYKGYEIRIEKEKQETSTISGDLRKVIRVLEELLVLNHTMHFNPILEE